MAGDIILMASNQVSIQSKVFERLKKFRETKALDSNTKAIDKLLKKEGF